MDGLSPDISAGLQRLGYQFVPFLLAVVGHEFGHGLAAYLWGDKTAHEQGRLTLNPVPHIDPLGTLLFPIISMFSGMSIMFGWARPVPIDPRRFKKFRPGLFWVSLAGAGANFVMAFACAIGLCLLLKYAPPDFFFIKELVIMLEVGVFINYGLGVFNLLPIPPLDGSKIVESMLSYSAMQKYERLAQYSFFILMALIFTGALSFLQKPVIFMGNFTLGITAQILNVPVSGM